MTSLLPWVLVGCIEFGLDPIDDPNPPPELVVVTETFVQQPLPAMDVLFVVDATQSMSQELAVLSEGVSGLVQALDDTDVSWQLGVVAAAAGPSAGTLRGSPWVMTPDLPDVAASFAEALPQPSLVAGEAGIAAAVDALDAARDGVNAGFRRDGATLLVVFVSDGDDDSGDLLGADPVQYLLDALDDEELTYGAPARVGALVGDPPDGCTSTNGAARPAPIYHRVVDATEGVWGSVCSLDFGGLLSGVAQEAVVYPVRFPLDRTPATDDVQVRVDGAEVTGWFIDEGPALVFDEAPAAGAQVEVSYVVSNTSSASSSPSGAVGSATLGETSQ